MTDVPAHLTRYPCGDYFASEYAERGYWCEPSQLQVVFPRTGVEELTGRDFLVIGRAGVDGIMFGYRAGQAGVWAYYPIGGEYQLVANSVGTLVEKWAAGSIVL